MNKKNKPRDTPNPEITIPKGYEMEEMMDTDSDGYGFEEPNEYEEVVLKIE